MCWMSHLQDEASQQEQSDRHKKDIHSQISDENKATKTFIHWSKTCSLIIRGWFHKSDLGGLLARRSQMVAALRYRQTETPCFIVRWWWWCCYSATYWPNGTKFVMVTQSDIISTHVHQNVVAIAQSIREIWPFLLYKPCPQHLG